MKQFTLERNLTSAQHVTSPLPGYIVLKNIKCFTLEKSPTPAKHVTSPLRD